ncbi:MAG: tyrosine--tRNA ligase [Planctomycetota bacterium]
MTAPLHRPGDFLHALRERNLIQDYTRGDIDSHLQEPRTIYIGFDPTADSLHVGSLATALQLIRAARCGHRAIALVGGATALIGDPSGKQSNRPLLTLDEVRANTSGIDAQLRRLAANLCTDRPIAMVDNHEWLGELGLLDFLREIGRHFTVSRMLTQDSVRNRLESGCSFTEFSYSLLQGYDFLHLARTQGCTVQMGGSDQWGNMIAGVELARRKDRRQLHAATSPLITKSDGSKFGKTESGNVWLDPARTTPDEFYQFWRSCRDSDVARLFAHFTLLDVEEIAALTRESGQALEHAKEVLAHTLTTMVHGLAAAQEAAKRSVASVGAGNATLPCEAIDAARLENGIGIIDLILRAGFATSRSAARRLILGGAVRINGERIGEPDHRTTTASLDADGSLLLQVGKKRARRFAPASEEAYHG